MRFTKYNHLSSGIRVANALTAVIIFIWVLNNLPSKKKEEQMNNAFFNSIGFTPNSCGRLWMVHGKEKAKTIISFNREDEARHFSTKKPHQVYPVILHSVTDWIVSEDLFRELKFIHRRKKNSVYPLHTESTDEWSM